MAANRIHFRQRGWVLTWLLLFWAATGLRASDPDNYPSALHLLRTLNLPDTISAQGAALARGRGGEIYALLDHPPSIVAWSSEGTLLGRFGDLPGMLVSPTDITTFQGRELLIADPWQGAVIRFDRRFKELPRLDLTGAMDRLEPVALAAMPDGSLYFINSRDGDIWRLDRSGKLTPQNWNKRQGGFLNDAKCLEADSSGRLVILDGSRLVAAEPIGGNQIETSLQDSLYNGMGVEGSEVWICSDSVVACYDLNTLQRRFGASLRFSDSIESLSAQGSDGIADVLPLGAESLALLTRNRPRVLLFQVERAGQERP